MPSALRLLRHFVRAAFFARTMVVVLAAAFSLPALGGACCAGATWLATDDGAAERADDACGDHESGEGESAPCQCPVPCAAGCTGFLGRALPQLALVELIPPAAQTVTLLRSLAGDPSNPDPRDILHVPKHARA
jgi:hypothetical protein